jgi:patatin-like phospholipase/acyl hydrolase
VSLEKKIKQKTKNPGARIADCFDLIAGTSTGGILTCIYLCPGEGDNRTRPRFTAEEAVGLYLDKGGEIFDVTLWQNIRSLWGVLDEKYDAGALETALRDYFGELKLSDLLKPCLVTAYNIEDRCAKFFTQHDAVVDEEQDYYVKDVARSTSAAPVYFEAEKIDSLRDVPYSLIDGGVFANNPALCAYAEVRHKFAGKPTAKDIAILSLGTGYIKKEYKYEDARNWGAIEWVRPLIDILMSGVAEVVDYQLAQIYNAVECPAQYLRINSTLQYARPEMDCASPENLENLRLEGARIAEEFDDALDDFITLLLP